MATLDIVRQHVGRRSRITRTEMRAILHSLAHAGLDLANPYVSDTLGGDAADAWVRACRDIRVISVDARGLRDGYVRYDEPGSMHPMQRAELMFVSAALGDYDYDQIGQMRRHADRVLIVQDNEAEDA